MIFLSEREVVSICQSVKCYFGNLTVVYFFNYRYRPTYSFRRERFSGGLIRRKKISLSRINLKKDFRMKSGWMKTDFYAATMLSEFDCSPCLRKMCPKRRDKFAWSFQNRAPLLR